MWTLHTDSGNNVYGGQTAKNIYLGETRIVTKLNSGDEPTYQEEYYKQYYYHSDHLGSASLITDYKGDEYQRIEYTPYGETWVEKTGNTGLEYLPYRFTGKEIDEETGLYYYGARYLDPRYSRWISTDPALGEYIPSAGKATASEAGSLPGIGGVFNTVNLQLYHYAGNNPVKYTDPDGRSNFDIFRADVASLIVAGPLGFITNKYIQYLNDDVRNKLTEETQSNTNPANAPEKWEALSPENSVFHQPDNGDKVTKYVSKGDGGKKETCWNETKGEVLKDPKTRATYNFGGSLGLKHALLDVIPWILYGTGKDDPSNFEDRLSQTLDAGVDRMKIQLENYRCKDESAKIMEKYYE